MKKISIGNEPHGEVIVEGELGEITNIELVEGMMLQISGENGVFRMDITERELDHGFSKKTKNEREVKK